MTEPSYFIRVAAVMPKEQTFQPVPPLSEKWVGLLDDVATLGDEVLEAEALGAAALEFDMSGDKVVLFTYKRGNYINHWGFWVCRDGQPVKFRRPELSARIDGEVMVLSNDKMSFQQWFHNPHGTISLPVCLSMFNTIDLRFAYRIARKVRPIPRTEIRSPDEAVYSGDTNARWNLLWEGTTEYTRRLGRALLTPQEAQSVGEVCGGFDVLRSVNLGSYEDTLRIYHEALPLPVLARSLLLEYAVFNPR